MERTGIMELTVDKLRNMDSRQHGLERKLYDIEVTVSGRCNSILPDITDLSGRWSEAGIQRFVDENINVLDDYGRANNLWRADGCRAVIADRMPDVLRKYMDAFLYCAVTAILIDAKCECNTSDTSLVSTFEQIYQMAAGLERGEMRYDDVFAEKYSGERMRNNLLTYCDPLYESFTGRSIKELITDEMSERADRLYSSDAQRINGFSADINDLPEDEREMVSEELDWLDSASQDELSDVLGQSVTAAEEMDECLDDSESFTDPKCFCNKYKEFREIYFSDEIPCDLDFAAVVKRMLNVYLCSKGRSSYGGEDTYSDSYIYVKRAHRMVRMTAGQQKAGRIEREGV